MWLLFLFLWNTLCGICDCHWGFSCDCQCITATCAAVHLISLVNGRDHFVYAPSQWETVLQCNVSHCLGAFTEWSLQWSWQLDELLHKFTDDQCTVWATDCSGTLHWTNQSKRLIEFWFTYPLCSKSTSQIDGLVQKRHNSIADALELRLSCTNPLRWFHHKWASIVDIPHGISSSCLDPLLAGVTLVTVPGDCSQCLIVHWCGTPISCQHSVATYWWMHPMLQTRADLLDRFAISQWETALLCNDVSHWLGASLESTLSDLSLISHSLMVELTTIWHENSFQIMWLTVNLLSHNDASRGHWSWFSRCFSSLVQNQIW